MEPTDEAAIRAAIVQLLAARVPVMLCPIVTPAQAFSDRPIYTDSVGNDENELGLLADGGRIVGIEYAA